MFDSHSYKRVCECDMWPSLSSIIEQINLDAKQSEVYGNFINSLDSEVTKDRYSQSLKYFMQYLKIETYEALLEIDNIKLEGLIRNYIVYMRQEKKSSPSTVSARIAAITHFFEMNDITLHWKKLKKFKGKFRNITEDRPYSREEVKKLVDSAASIRDKCIILLMASSGMRRGAIPYLRLRDMQRVEKYQLYKFNVYKKEQESYITYLVLQNVPSLSVIIYIGVKD